MNIVFYSTNSNNFSPDSIETTEFPCKKEIWQHIAAEHPNDNIFILTQLPGNFLIDYTNTESPCKNIKIIISKETEAQNIAKQIVNLNPDIAIAATFWTAPFDWLGIKDALIGEILLQKSIKTIFHPLDTAVNSFDKNRTYNILKELNFIVPKTIHVNHQLYWCERGRKEIQINFYKEYIQNEIKKMKFPIIIKDSYGLSSYGMEVAVSYNQAIHYLNSGKTNTDRIIEEFIDGTHFGTEIYGTPGSYTILPPFIFSLNSFGITSPKQSIKIGPITDPKYKIDELTKKLQVLAEKMQFSGIAQIDLIYKNNEWYIIEINPRLSGLSQTYAASLDIPIQQILLKIAQGNTIDISKLKFTCNFKMPILPKNTIEEIYKLPFVKHIHQIHNKNAKQEREKGYCETIFGRTDTIAKLQEQLQQIKEKFPQAIEPVFFENTIKMIKKLQD